MTNEQIDRMISEREKLTNVRDEQVDWVTVDAIDAMLRDIPPGRDNRIDLRLGRMCAVLPKRVVMVQHADGAQEVAPEFDVTPADMKRIAADAMQNHPPIEY